MKVYLLIFAAVLLNGCATTAYRPLVDTGEIKGVYELDLADCQALANQRPAGQSAAAGAVGGALLGAALGAAFGLNGHDIGRLAGVGAVSGGAQGAIDGSLSQQQIVGRCMEGRGYNVLSY